MPSHLTRHSPGFCSTTTCSKLNAAPCYVSTMPSGMRGRQLVRGEVTQYSRLQGFVR